MKLYTSKVIAEWIGLTDRRVRQLRDQGILPEARPGLWELQPTIRRYTEYLRRGSDELNEERAKLTAEKRKAAERENRIKDREVHRTEDIERGMTTVFLNVRGRFLSLPAKLSPTLATMGGNQGGIFDVLKEAIEEVLGELSNYRVALQEGNGEEDGKA